jgi:ubiquinone/menaquinone biosynthesis C-methylase UbiE
MMEARSLVDRPDEQLEATTDELRAGLHRMWASVAPSWAEHANYLDERGAAITEQMLALTLPQHGERVLELACGPGSVGLAAAERVAPGGEVVVSDVVPEMTSIAAARAKAHGLENVVARVLDLEDIEEPDASYDVALCREGLMLVPDPARGAREIRRVLRSGGRVAVAVWGPRAQNPWLSLLFDVVSAQLGAPIPPPEIPHPFSLDDPDQLAGLLVDAGFSHVVVEAVPTPYYAASFDEWWNRCSSLAGPLAQRLAALPPPALHALRARARRAVVAYETPDGFEFPGVSLVAAAHRT